MQLPYGAQAATYYPLNTEIIYLWALLPLHSDFLVNLVQVPFWLACAAGVYGLARRVDVGKQGAAIGAVLMLFIPGLVQQVTVARVDVAFCAWLVLSLYFVFTWADTRRTVHLVLFAVCLGMLAGTKSLGVVYSFLPLLFLLLHLPDRGWKALTDIAIVAITGIAFGGFWYVRNWIVTGNPVFPLNFAIGGTTIFPGAYGKEAMQAFHVEDPRELGNIGSFFINIWMMTYIMLSVFLCSLLVLLRKRHGNGRMFLLAAPWIITALFWFVNPHNNLTNGRFMFPAFILFMFPVCMILDRMKEKWTYVWALLGLGAVVGSSVMQGTDHLFLLSRDLLKVAAGIGQGGPLTAAAPALRLLIPGVLGCAVAIALKKKPAFAAITGLVALILLFSGMSSGWRYQAQNKYNWYKSFPVGSAWARLDEMTKGYSLNIASVGNERMYGLFGTGLRHNVVTVSVTENPTVDFHYYWKKAQEEGRGFTHQERPQFHREKALASAWVENLKKQDIDFVFATVLDPIARLSMEHDQRGFPVEVRWADADFENFALKFSNEEVRIYAVKK